MNREREYNITSEEMIRLYVDEGMSLESIGKIAGCALETVRRRLLKRRIETRDSANYTLLIPKEEIVRLYVEELWQVQEIAEIAGCDYSTVSYHLKNEGVEKRLDNHYKLNISKEKLVDLYEQELPYQEIAEIAGCTASNISNHLVNMGLGSNRDYRIYKVRDRDMFYNVDTEEKAYILGLLYADGCNEPDRNRITLNLKASDIALVEQVRDVFYEDRPVLIKKAKNETSEETASLVICNETISKDLENLGVVARKSLILEYPDFYLGDLENHFIRGYFDGDGHIGKMVTRWSIWGTYNFIYDLRDRLYINASVPKNKIYENKTSSLYGIQHGSRLAFELFFDYIYRNATIYLDRKYQRFVNTLDDFTD
jgi:DNA-binding CsgD family transcriptional regulator